MTASTALLRGLDRAVYLALGATFVGAMLVFPPFIQAPVKIGTEAYLVVAAWTLVALIAAAQGLRGLPVLGGGEGTWPRRLVAAFAAWVLLAGLWAAHPATYWGHAAALAAFLLAAQSLWGWIEAAPGRRGYVMALIAVVAVGEAAVVFAQYAGVPWRTLWPTAAPGGLVRTWLEVVEVKNVDFRVTGTLGNPNYVGELLALLTPVLAGWAASRRTLPARTAFGAAAALAFVALLLTGTRAGFLGLVVGMAGAGALAAAWRPDDVRALWADARRRAALMALAVAVVAAGGLASGQLAKKFALGITTDASVVARVHNWQAGVDLLAARPIQGIGLGSWKLEGLAALARRHPDGVPPSTNGMRFAQLHNEWLQAAVEFGAIGFLMLLGALVGWLGEVRRNPTLPAPARWGMVAGVAALLVASLSGFPFHVPLAAFVGLTCLVLAAAREPDAEVGPDDALPPTTRVAYAAVAFGLAASVGALTVARGTVPAYMAARYHYLAQEAEKHDRLAPGVGMLFRRAAELDRVKSHHVYDLMQWQIRTGKDAEAIATYDRYASYGPGFAERVLRGIACYRQGRTAEAKADLLAATRFYDPGHRNYAMAHKYLVKMGAAEGLAKPGEARPAVKDEGAGP